MLKSSRCFLLIAVGISLGLISFTKTARATTGWLSTNGNHIIDSNGNLWHGRGANIFDPLDNSTCGYSSSPPTFINTTEVKRRIGALAGWGTNFIRMPLDTNNNVPPGGSLMLVGSYASAVRDIVAYAAQFPGLYLELTPFKDASQNSNEVPTAATSAVYRALVGAVGDYSNVIFGLTNEPHSESPPYALDETQLRQAMSAAVKAIRAEEATRGLPNHLIAVQGNSHASDVNLYTQSPITGGNIIYEVHTYTGVSSGADYNSLFLIAAKKIPVIVGEYGPSAPTPPKTTDFQCGGDQYDTMTLASDVPYFQNAMRKNDIPHMGWTFDPYGAPNMLLLRGGNSAPQNCPSGAGSFDSSYICSGALDLSYANLTTWGQVFVDDIVSNSWPTRPPGSVPAPEPSLTPAQIIQIIFWIF